MNRTMRPGAPGGPPGREGGVHTAKAVVLIIVLVLIGALVLSKTALAGKGTAAAGAASHATTTLKKGAVTVPPPTTSTTLVPVSAIKVQVLNGVLTGSLAGQWSAKLRANPGYDTLTADNATSRVTASVIYIITPGYQAEANALAATVGLPSSKVDTTIPPPASAPIPTTERTKANLVLVVGPDLAGTA